MCALSVFNHLLLGRAEATADTFPPSKTKPPCHRLPLRRMPGDEKKQEQRLGARGNMANCQSMSQCFVRRRPVFYSSSFTKATPTGKYKRNYFGVMLSSRCHGEWQRTKRICLRGTGTSQRKNKDWAKILPCTLQKWEYRQCWCEHPFWQNIGDLLLNLELVFNHQLTQVHKENKNHTLAASRQPEIYLHSVLSPGRWMGRSVAFYKIYYGNEGGGMPERRVQTWSEKV